MTSTTQNSTSLLVLLCLIITGLCCMTFYLYRTVTSKSKEHQDMTKAVDAAVSTVLTLTNNGIPGLNRRIAEFENRMRGVEQNIKSKPPTTSGGSSADAPPLQPSEDEEAIMAARAARLKASANSEK